MCSSSSRRLPAVSRRPSSTGTSLTNYAPRTGRSGCLAELSQSLDWSRRVDMGAFDPSAACFVRHGGVIPDLAEGVTGWLAGQRVAGGSRSSGGCRHRVKMADVDSRGRACRCDRARSGVQTRRLTGAPAANTRATQVRVREGSNTPVTRTEKRKVGSSILPLTTSSRTISQPSYLRRQQEERDSHGAECADSKVL